MGVDPRSGGRVDLAKAGLDALLSDVPADRIDLEQAGYGYAWVLHHRAQLSDDTSRQLATQAHRHARWSPAIGEWTARPPDHTTVW